MDEGVRRRIERLLLGGVAVVVATADDEAVPTITRGWGPRVDPTSGRLRLAVTARSGSAMEDQLAVGRAVSVTLSEMPTYATVQVKGVIEEVRPPSAGDLELVDDHLGRFVDAAARLGITSGAENFFLGDLVMVEVAASRLYEQTPGEHAGQLLTGSAPIGAGRTEAGSTEL